MLNKISVFCFTSWQVFSLIWKYPKFHHNCTSVPLSWPGQYNEVLNISSARGRLGHDFLLLKFPMLWFFSASLITALYCGITVHLKFTLTSGCWCGRIEVLWDLGGLLHLSTLSTLLSESLNILALMGFRMLASNLVQFSIIGSMSYTYSKSLTRMVSSTTSGAKSFRTPINKATFSHSHGAPTI